MYCLKANSTSYVIPFDAVDVNGILTRFGEYGDSVKPLWSSTRQEYYEFVVNAWKDSDGKSTGTDAADRTSEKHKCHLCNIEFPKIVYLNHMNSGKHKAFTKIADAVLLRARDHMASELEAVALSAHQPCTLEAEYFCECCSIIVSNKDKSRHEASQAHKKLASYDKMLNELVMVYLDVNNIDKIGEGTENSEDKGNHKKAKIESVEKSVVHVCKEDTASVKQTNNQLNKYVENNVSEACEIDTAILKQTRCQEKKYIRRLSYEFGNRAIKIFPTKDNFILITVKGFQLKVKIDNFHGFIQDIRNDTLLCMLCHQYFDDPKMHASTSDHMKNVMCSLTDQHCIRELNEYHTHCILCNELIQNIEEHKTVSIRHKKKLEEALIHRVNKCITKTEGANLPTSNKTFCNVCAVYVDTTKFENHIKSNVHVALELFFNDGEKIVTVGKDNRTVQQTEEIEPDCYSKDGSECLNFSGNYFLPEDFDTDENNSHPDSDNYENVENTVSFARICDSADSKTASIFNSVNRCSVETKTGKTFVQDNSDIKNTQNSVQTEPFVQSTDERVLRYWMEATGNCKEVKCKICFVIVPNVFFNWQGHVNGKAHKKTYEKFLLDNKLKRVDNKIICEVCQVEIYNMNEFEHINSKSHITNFLKITPEQDTYEHNVKTNVQNIKTYLEKDNPDLHNVKIDGQSMVMDIENTKSEVSKVKSNTTNVKASGSIAETARSTHKLKRVGNKFICEDCQDKI